MNSSRRSFIKLSLVSLASLPFLAQLLGGRGTTALAAGADLPFPVEKEEPAKSLKYCANADKPSANCASRKAKDKAGQYCYTCQLYTKLEGEKKASKGKCMVMPRNRVHGGGWCQSWVKNPVVNA